MAVVRSSRPAEANAADDWEPAYVALARAFRAEGVDTQFTLMGDGNMYWSTAFAELPGTSSFYVRHEHCACGMAIAYAHANDTVGVASVTCGPGFTQIGTALVSAYHAHIPIVVLAGETPSALSWHNQSIDQAPLALAAKAKYISIQRLDRLQNSVREAFFTARTERIPVVLGMPYDLQQEFVPRAGDYVPSLAYLADGGRPHPDPERIVELSARIQQSKKIVVIGGRGARTSGAQSEIVKLAERCGALLSATLPVRGIFDADPFSIGIAGGYARKVGLDAFKECDLVIAVGASLTNFTRDGGKLFPQAYVVQIDENPVGLKHGAKVADSYIRSDARTAIAALNEQLSAADFSQEGFRSKCWMERIEREPADPHVFEIEDGQLDPRRVSEILDKAIPKDWELVSGTGHSSWFHSQMRGRPIGKFHSIREFAAIGNGISFAMGVAAARPSANVVLFEGDGSLLMHIQELETIHRHSMKILVCVFNDGAYGAEIHKLQAEGVGTQGAVFERPDFAAIARGFSIPGVTITDEDQFDSAIAEFESGETAMVLDIHISRSVIAPLMRRKHPAK